MVGKISRWEKVINFTLETLVKNFLLYSEAYLEPSRTFTIMPEYNFISDRTDCLVETLTLDKVTFRPEIRQNVLIKNHDIQSFCGS